MRITDDRHNKIYVNNDLCQNHYELNIDSLKLYFRTLLYWYFLYFKRSYIYQLYFSWILVCVVEGEYGETGANSSRYKHLQAVHFGNV